MEGFSGFGVSLGVREGESEVGTVREASDRDWVVGGVRVVRFSDKGLKIVDLKLTHFSGIPD